MKKIIATLVCALFLSAPAFAHCGSCGVEKAEKTATKSCCAPKKEAKSCCAKEVAKTEKCAKCEKKSAAKDCNSCSTASWMMPKAQCGSCSG